ncbi:MAG: hypothetical protein M1835_005852 [Candelina submexicana]|nr:MAG: hypothetical protein M1835_005852 [Candelina submexicana]
MLFKSTIVAAATVLFAGQALASAIAEPEMLVKRVATDPWSACQAPRNSDHREGLGHMPLYNKPGIDLPGLSSPLGPWFQMGSLSPAFICVQQSVEG